MRVTSTFSFKGEGLLCSTSVDPRRAMFKNSTWMELSETVFRLFFFARHSFFFVCACVAQQDARACSAPTGPDSGIMSWAGLVFFFLTC
jgi:hypothetical protein